MTTPEDRKLSEHEVRLFPSVHITSDKEAELRATASLLSVILAVSEFGKRIVRICGGPVGRLSCFTEVPFKLNCGSGNPPEELRPDGIVDVVRGKKHWKALVEVKVGKNNLDSEQIDKYHRLARQIGASSLLTVSNQPALPDGRPPVNLDGRRLRTLPVTHFSWERLLSEAQVLSRKKGVSDPDQKWILDEWIRYVDDPESRIITPPDLGPHWFVLLKAAKTSALNDLNNELIDVASHWQGYLRKAALRLRAKLGVDVELKLSRKEKSDSQIHLDRTVLNLRSNGVLSGVLRIPDAAGDVHIDVFLHSRSVRYSFEVSAPPEGRQLTRLTWLSRQLKKADLPANATVTSEWTARGLITTTAGTQFVDRPESLIIDRNGASIPKDAFPKKFLIQWTTKLQVGRGRSSAPVLEGISTFLEDFYLRVVESVAPFVPRVPRLIRKVPEPSQGHETPNMDDTATNPSLSETTSSQGDSEDNPTSNMNDQ